MLTEALVGAFTVAEGDVSDPRVREAYGILEGWTSVAVNLLVFAVKIVPGLAIGSISLIADAFHSLGDVASSGVVIWGFKAAAKPSDAEHPFGHGRVESVATLVIAVLLLVAAVEFGQSAVARLLHPREVRASAPLLVVLLLTLVLKEWLSRFSLHLGRRIGSTALVADFWHHRSDVLATGVVILALAASSLGVPWLDGAAGLVVAGFLAWAGVHMVRGALDPLIGEAPSPGLVRRIRETALAVEGVEEVHDVIVHRYGSLIVTSLHIEVPVELDVSRGHELAEDVEDALAEAVRCRATVHVDPVDRHHPLYSDVSAFLAQAAGRLDEPVEVHDLRIVGRAERCFVIFDVSADGVVGEGAVARLRAEVEAKFPAVAKVIVNVEPRFVY